VTDETLQQIDSTLLTMAGNDAFAIQYGGGSSAVKNSARPSQSDESLPDSGQGKPSKKDGSSGRTRGQKIPSTSSRRGRGK
jgi:hypothetical protein